MKFNDNMVNILLVKECKDRSRPTTAQCRAKPLIISSLEPICHSWRNHYSTPSSQQKMCWFFFLFHTSLNRSLQKSIRTVRGRDFIYDPRGKTVISSQEGPLVEQALLTVALCLFKLTDWDRDQRGNLERHACFSADGETFRVVLLLRSRFTRFFFCSWFFTGSLFLFNVASSPESDWFMLVL